MTGEPGNVETIPTAYGDDRSRWRQPLPATVVAAVTVAVVVGAWRAEPLLGGSVGVAAVVAAVAGRVRPTGVGVLSASVLVVVAGAASGWRAEQAWEALVPDRLGPNHGWVTLVDDPATRRGATRVVAIVEGERVEMWIRGRAVQRRVAAWRAGERVMVAGERFALRPDRAARVAWERIVAELRPTWVGDVVPGSPLSVATNRVRGLLERSTATLPPADGALLRGLVVGDDRDQPDEMVERFRASGLAHLTAVSGQNVALVLAAAAPVLRRLGTWTRLAVTLGLIGWFLVLTRFEPSILRAGTMAALASVATATGRERSAPRLLALAVAGLVAVDPLLVRSIGFWMSVGATAGVAVVGPVLTRLLRRLGPLAAPVGVTLGAQVGVMVPTASVFGIPPLVSLPANLFAVPVAGFVMLVGLPAGLVAGAVADVAPWSVPVLLLAAHAGVRWVDTVAALGARLEPGGAWSSLGWVLVATAVLGVAWRRRAAERAPMR